jgi:hypothetical protein
VCVCLRAGFTKNKLVLTNVDEITVAVVGPIQDSTICPHVTLLDEQ